MARPRKNSATPGLPKKPEHLSPEASKEWDRLFREVQEAGIDITVAHRAALTLAATIAADISTDWAEIQREGAYSNSAKGGIQAHPAVKRMDALRRDYIKVLSVIGLRPGQAAEGGQEKSLNDLLED